MVKKYYILALLFALFAGACTVDVIDRGGDDEEEEDDSYVVEWMDGILSTDYLYNDEYNSTARDLTWSYDLFLDIALKSLETNVLDYKNGSLYTDVTRTISTKSATRLSDNKVSEISIGLASAVIVEYSGSDQRGVGVLAVYPDSPLDEAGVKRGDIITSVRGTQLTSSNYSGWSKLLLSPTIAESSYSLEFEAREGVTVMSTYMQCNPVLKSDIYEEGEKKIGYIAYYSFDAAWDEELMAVMSNFKNEGITDLILDMRLNGGGYVSSAKKLASSIGGSATSGQVFANYTYNDTRMAQLSDSYKVQNFSTGWDDYYLDIDNFVCLVSGYTASASELVINSLRGIGEDADVVLIGEQTEGKNVAMEVYDLTYDGYDYEFLPITILLSNAKGYNDYSAGFTVDHEASDWGDYGENFADFTEDEIMISAAINYITTGLYEDPIRASMSTKSPSTILSKIKGDVVSTSSKLSGNIHLQE